MKTKTVGRKKAQSGQMEFARVHIQKIPEGTIYSSNGKKFFVSPAGRKLLVGLKKKYGKSFLRGEIPVEREKIYSGPDSIVYKIKIGEHEFVEKQYLSKFHHPISQARRAASFKPQKLRKSKTTIRATTPFFANNDSQLMKLLKEKTIRELEHENPKLYDSCMQRIVECPMEHEIFRKFEEVFVKFDEKTGKLIFTIVDL